MAPTKRVNLLFPALSFTPTVTSSYTPSLPHPNQASQPSTQKTFPGELRSSQFSLYAFPFNYLHCLHWFCTHLAPWQLLSKTLSLFYLFVLNVQSKSPRRSLPVSRVFTWHYLSQTFRIRSEVAQKTPVAKSNLDTDFHLWEQVTKTQCRNSGFKSGICALAKAARTDGNWKNMTQQGRGYHCYCTYSCFSLAKKAQ